jgi:SAM-dependent methyltransferase/UDP-N-acetylglucosamine transferase subunit ALG13
MARVLATMGMTRWPFDRLVTAVDALGDRHEVFVQTAGSTVVPRAPHAAQLSPAELDERIRWADVVVVHAGNTVRHLQRRGIVPVVVAREAKRGEAADDHQIDFLRREERAGRVVAVWDIAELPAAIDDHATRAAAVASRPLPPEPDTAAVAACLDGALERLDRLGPFARHPLRRYDFAWRQLVGIDGAHLDLGCNDGLFAHALATIGGRRVVGVDVMADYLAEAVARTPRPVVVQVDRWARLPFPSAVFGSASLLDVLEHVPDEDSVLAEVARVLAPGGRLVVTVPARHLLSVLDPDDAKFRFPRAHAAIYRARFGDQRYRERFVDLSNGYRGDLAVERDAHTNYEPAVLLDRLRRHGLEPVERTGANLWWQLANPLRLLGGRRAQRLAERATELDGRWFDRANLFVAARRIGPEVTAP